MGKPMIAYGLTPLTNFSFETDAVATTAPTGWATTGSVNGALYVDDAYAARSSVNAGGTKSLRQNVQDGTAGNKSLVSQRVAHPAADWIKLYGAGEIAVFAFKRPYNQTAQDNSLLRMVQYDALTGGNSLTAPSSRHFLTGPDGAWLCEVTAQGVHASAASVEVILDYDISRDAYDATADVWWDRVYLGVLFDFDKQFRDISMTQRGDYGVNVGNGLVEVVAIGNGMTEIKLTVGTVMDDDLHPMNAKMKRFFAFNSSMYVTPMVLWCDRDKFTNAGKHYAKVALDPSVKVDISRGVEYRDYDIKMIAAGDTVG